MFDDPNIIVGLEIGTSKVCAVVGEQAADGSLNIIGVGQSRSRGVRKGEIVDPEQAEEDVRNAVIFERCAPELCVKSSAVLALTHGADLS